MTAYLGKILWVDLPAHQCREEHILDKIYAQYLSGIGLAAYLLYERIHALADALGPHNVLAFVSGLLAGTPSSYTGRWMAAAKLPLTNTWGETNCVGYFGMAIKQCGYDGIFFRGVSPTPVYLYLGASAPELHDASDRSRSRARTNSCPAQALKRLSSFIYLLSAGKYRLLLAAVPDIQRLYPSNC